MATEINVPSLTQIFVEKNGSTTELQVLQMNMAGREVTVWAKYSVTISGQAKVGQKLVANISPSNTPIHSYQWYRNSTAISGATSREYTLTADDVGKTIKCRTYQNAEKTVYVDSGYTDTVTGWITYTGDYYVFNGSNSFGRFTASATINGWGSSSDSYPSEAWKVFDANDSTYIRAGVNSTVKKHGITAEVTFPQSIRIKKFYVNVFSTTGLPNQGKPSDAYTFSTFIAEVYGRTNGAWQLMASKQYDLHNYYANEVTWAETISRNDNTEYDALRIVARYGSGDYGQTIYVRELDVEQWEVYG